MKPKTILLIMLFAASLFPGELMGGFQHTDFGESVAIGKNFYHKVKIVFVSDNGMVTLSTNDGDVKISWDSLPADFRNRHVADIENLKKQQKSRTEYDTGIRELEVKIVQNVKNGVLAGKKLNLITGETQIIFVEGISAVADGAEFVIKAKRDGLYQYSNTGGSNSTVEKWVLISFIK